MALICMVDKLLSGNLSSSTLVFGSSRAIWSSNCYKALVVICLYCTHLSSSDLLFSSSSAPFLIVFSNSSSKAATLWFEESSCPFRSSILFSLSLRVSKCSLIESSAITSYFFLFPSSFKVLDNSSSRLATSFFSSAIKFWYSLMSLSFYWTCFSKLCCLRFHYLAWVWSFYWRM